MKKIVRRIALLVFVLTLIAGIVKVIMVYDDIHQLKTFFNKTEQRKNPPVHVKVPDFRALAIQQGGALEPTPAQIKEQKNIENAQVAIAGQWLASANAQQRHIGAEQLSAYPTPEAEKMLITALHTDSDASVRGAAAESLSAFESLSIPAIASLLAAMDDADENVQFNAFSTLQNQIANEEGKSKRYQIIMKGLRKKMKSARLSENMRSAVRGFIEDQQLSQEI